MLIVGEKERPDLTKRGPASFHLVERDFGRFARAVRVNARHRRVAGRGATGQRRAARRAAPHRAIGAAPGMLVPDRVAGRATRMKLLFIGDIVGRPGRDLVRRARARAGAAHAAPTW